MATNPYTGPTIAGYNASPPPDDGSTTASNKLEWAKHISKIGDPLVTFAEAINTAVNNAFNSLIVTDDIAQETAIVGYDRFSNIRSIVELMFSDLKRRLTTLESTANTIVTSDNNVIAVEVLGNKDPIAELRYDRLNREIVRTRTFVVEDESAIVATDYWR